jgi:hypothetical protein
MWLQSPYASYLKLSSKSLVFNIDLHISVIADLKPELKNRGIKVIEWSISGSNKFRRKIFKISDPVKHINNNNWLTLNNDLISKFENEYRFFLKKFNGFVVTHTPSFAQLYRSFDKPILIVNSTRYEAPYTNCPHDWMHLNEFLISGVERRQILLVSNNKADADYLNYFTGLSSKIVPSLCRYTNFNWTGGGHKKVIISRSPVLQEDVEHLTLCAWMGLRKSLGSKYSWQDFKEVAEVCVIPYNISTMTLFEFATSGIPVAVPSPKFLLELHEKYEGVLSELSYYQTRKLPVGDLSHSNPNNYLSPKFFQWWLERADFYDSDLMPNVRVIDSFDELENGHPASSNLSTYLSKILARNHVFAEKQKNLLSVFQQMI